MKEHNILYLFLLILLVPLAACNDDDDAEPSRRALLTADIWEGNAVFAQGRDITQFMADSADLDITEWTLKFNDDGTYTSEFVGSQPEEGTWEFSDNEQELIFDKGTQGQDEVRIARLSSTELYLDQTLQFLNPQGQPENVEIEMRFRR